MNNSGWSLRSRGKSFGYAWKGICALFRQPNACIHAFVTAIVLVCGWYYSITQTEWCLVALCIGGVLMAEAFNSSVEALADKVSPGYDSLIGRAKDLAAGAVLLFVAAAVVVGLVIFLPHFIDTMLSWM